MEERGTGLRPNRLPSEWEKRPLAMTQEAPQGPAVGPAVTARRDLRSTAEVVGPGGFMGEIMRSRPSAQVEARAQEAIPSEVIDCLESAPNNFIVATIAGGSFDAERVQPEQYATPVEGNPGPTGGMITKSGVKGSTLSKGAI